MDKTKNQDHAIKIEQTMTLQEILNQFIQFPYYGEKNHEWVKTSLSILKQVFQHQYGIEEKKVRNIIKFPNIQYQYQNNDHTFMEGLDKYIVEHENQLRFTTEKVFNKLVEKQMAIRESHYQLFYGVCLYFTEAVVKESIKFELSSEQFIYKDRDNPKKNGRIDIFFKTNEGQSFIVELKKFKPDQINQNTFCQGDNLSHIKFKNIQQLKISALMQAQHYKICCKERQYEAAILYQLSKDKTEFYYCKSNSSLIDYLSPTEFYYEICPEDSLNNQSYLNDKQIDERRQIIQKSLDENEHCDLSEKWKKELKFLDTMQKWNKEEVAKFDKIQKESQKQLEDQTQLNSPQKCVKENDQCYTDSKSPFNSTVSQNSDTSTLWNLYEEEKLKNKISTLSISDTCTKNNDSQ